MHPLSRPLIAAQACATTARTGETHRARAALLAGATGKIGGHCLRLLLANPLYGQVHVAARREAPARRPKLRWRQTDFAALETIALPPIDDAFCVLGVRPRALADRRELELAEYAYPLAFARLAAASGARRFLTVTSVAASADSPLRYLRLKGRLEQALQTLGFQRLDVFRPSFLLSAGGVRAALNLPLRGPLRKYRAVSPRQVAEAMTAAAAAPESGMRIHHFGLRGPA